MQTSIFKDILATFIKKLYTYKMIENNTMEWYFQNIKKDELMKNISIWSVPNVWNIYDLYLKFACKWQAIFKI